MARELTNVDMMNQELKAARKARRGASDVEWTAAEALGQIADALIQIRWEMVELRGLLTREPAKPQ
jgi:hypothetical protein